MNKWISAFLRVLQGLYLVSGSSGWPDIGGEIDKKILTFLATTSAFCRQYLPGGGGRLPEDVRYFLENWNPERA